MPDGYEFVVVAGFKLPPGYNVPLTSILLEIPSDYPLSPPGIGNNKAYISPHLRYNGRQLRDVHSNLSPSYPTLGFGPWAWLCYTEIRWNPVGDDLIRFLEMMRADLTNPPTVQE
jgi:ubiquitin-protein ligase